MSLCAAGASSAGHPRAAAGRWAVKRPPNARRPDFADRFAGEFSAPQVPVCARDNAIARLKSLATVATNARWVGAYGRMALHGCSRPGSWSDPTSPHVLERPSSKHPAAGRTRDGRNGAFHSPARESRIQSPGEGRAMRQQPHWRLGIGRGPFPAKPPLGQPSTASCYRSRLRVATSTRA